MPVIERLHALEILDSRGRPTLLASCALRSGASGSASVPSGASTGAAEARELRDGDPARYRGLGCLRAAANVRIEINDALAGLAIDDQAQLDRLLVELDGSPQKSRLGANALLAVSLAWARACAGEAGLPLYRYFAQLPGFTTPDSLPRPTINLFSGGAHAGGQVPLQDLLIVPVRATRMAEALEICVAVYGAAADLMSEKYGARRLTADEGGLAPPFTRCEAMFEDALQAIETAGYRPGVDMSLALDVAASQFWRDGRYRLEGSLTSGDMIALLASWVQRWPLVSVEDGLAEEDWAQWPALKGALAGQALVLGDDLLCTNPGRIQRAIEADAADALLLKVNQIGTLSEAAEACHMARRAGWHVTVSARSGETEDNWLADLAVGWSGDHVKIGSITQSERLAKYNRLLEIADFSGMPLTARAGGH